MSGLTGGTVSSFDEGDRPMEPNYAALVKLLPLLHILVDATGEVRLTEEEVARIRALGFAAHAGKWQVPPLPPELVADNPLLEPLSAGYGSRPTHVTQPLSRGEKADGAEVEQREVGITEVGRKVLQVLENTGGRILKRRLQQKLWRFPAAVLNEALGHLVHRKLIMLQDNCLIAVTPLILPPAAEG